MKIKVLNHGKIFEEDYPSVKPLDDFKSKRYRKYAMGGKFNEKDGTSTSQRRHPQKTKIQELEQMGYKLALDPDYTMKKFKEAGKDREWLYPSELFFAVVEYEKPTIYIGPVLTKGRINQSETLQYVTMTKRNNPDFNVVLGEKEKDDDVIDYDDDKEPWTSESLDEETAFGDD